LFAMALFVWVLPVATVYPPSALTVSALSYTQTEVRNLSILDPPQTEIDPWNMEPDIESMTCQFESTVNPSRKAESRHNMTITTYYE
jgi:hypothetical protein